MLHSILIVSIFAALAVNVCAQWHRLPGPSAGGPYCYIEIPGSTRIYAGTVDGVWLSTDHMKSWTRAGMDGHYVTLISEFWDQASGVVLFAATYDALYRTIDTGKTWTQVDGTPQDFPLSAPITAVFQNSSNVFIVFSDAIDTATCVWRSSDLGDSWARFAPYVPELYGPNSVDTMNGILFALMEDGQFNYNLFSLSLAGGQWQRLDYLAGHNLSLIKANDRNLYAAGRGYIDLSTDLGVTWIPLLSNGLDSTTLPPPDNIAINGVNIIIDFDRDACVSTDGGSSWNRLDRHGEFSEGRALGFIDGVFLLSEGTGLFRSADAVTWESVPAPAQSPKVNLVATAQTSLFAVGTWGTIFQSTDKGRSWIEPGHLEGVSQLAVADQALFACWYGGLSRWSAGQWDSLGLPSSDYSLLLAAHDTILYYDGNFLWHSTDLGISWQQQPGKPLYSLFTLRDTLFAVTSRQMGYGFYELDLDLSSDWGTSWHNRSTLAKDSGGFYETLLVAASGSSIFISFSGAGLLSSSDAGYSWRLVDTDYVRCLSPIGTSIFASLSSQAPDHPSGLYDITNGFRLIVPDSITSSILSIAADDSLLYLGTVSRGLWANALANIPLAVPVGQFAQSGSLEVYPNPSTDRSTISFDLPSHTPVSIKLYDALGLMRTPIFDGEMDAGHHEIPFSNANLPNGIYELVLSTETNRYMDNLVIDR